jgi:hypothetical protein
VAQGLPATTPPSLASRCSRAHARGAAWLACVLGLGPERPPPHPRVARSARHRRRLGAPPHAAPPPAPPRALRPWPRTASAPSIFRDKNGRCIGRSQSKRLHKSTQQPPHPLSRSTAGRWIRWKASSATGSSASTTDCGDIGRAPPPPPPPPPPTPPTSPRRPPSWLLRRWSWAQGSPASTMRRCAAECARMGLSQFESSRALDATSVWKRERCASPPVSTSSDALAAAPAGRAVSEAALWSVVSGTETLGRGQPSAVQCSAVQPAQGRAHTCCRPLRPARAERTEAHGSGRSARELEHQGVARDVHADHVREPQLHACAPAIIAPAPPSPQLTLGSTESNTQPASQPTERPTPGSRPAPPRPACTINGAQCAHIHLGPVAEAVATRQQPAEGGSPQPPPHIVAPSQRERRRHSLRTESIGGW